ncbi:MAG: hypothetical protein H0W83_15820 [Planctomycetes bacterium]|nr:hypothetical protein [Planctomycetota bacterium]
MMVTPDKTSRIESNQKDLRAMRIREDILKATADLNQLAGLPADNSKAALIASLQRRIDELRKELIAEMKATDKLR